SEHRGRFMTELFVRNVDGPRPSGVLLGVQLPNVLEPTFESSLRELERLAHTLGIDVVGRVKQRRASLAPAAVVGQGKLRELAAWTGGTGEVPGYVAQGKRQHDDGEVEPADVYEAAGELQESGDGEPRASIVLVDHDLTPSQMRNLEKA